MRHVFGRPAPEAMFLPMFAKKADKYPDYSAGGIPVWLAYYVDTQLTYPLGTIQTIAGTEIRSTAISNASLPPVLHTA